MRHTYCGGYESLVINKAQRQAYIQCYEDLYQTKDLSKTCGYCVKPESDEDWVCMQFTPFSDETSATKCNMCGKEKWQHESKKEK